MAKWPYSTARWQRLRTQKLAHKPLCEVCTRRGQIVPASHVDHRTAISAGGETFPPLDALMSMCHSCHSVKTSATDNPHAYGDPDKKTPFKGCGVDGRPIDENHPFNSSHAPDTWLDRGCLQSRAKGRIGPTPQVSKEFSRKNWR